MEKSVLTGQYNVEAAADWLCVHMGGAFSDRIRVFYARWSRAASDTARKRNS